MHNDAVDLQDWYPGCTQKRAQIVEAQNGFVVHVKCTYGVIDAGHGGEYIYSSAEATFIFDNWNDMHDELRKWFIGRSPE